MQHILPMHKDKTANGPSTPTQPNFGVQGEGSRTSPLHATLKLPKVAEEGSDAVGDENRKGSATYNLPEVSSGYTPFIDAQVDHLKTSTSGERVTPIRLPSSLTTEDFTRAVAVATVSALRHQGSIIGTHGSHGSGRKERPSLLLGQNATKRDMGAHAEGKEEDGGGEHGEGGGHEAPEWTRAVSAGVLLSCTMLYAIIAGEFPNFMSGFRNLFMPRCAVADTSEILVDVVDVVLENIRIDEKFLGLTLFTLIPNVTEFMNAMSFALNGNIALR